MGKRLDDLEKQAKQLDIEVRCRQAELDDLKSRLTMLRVRILLLRSGRSE